MDIYPGIPIPVVAIVWTYSGIAPEKMNQRAVIPVKWAITTTVSNVAVGTLVTGGNTTGTWLFKIEDTATVRAFVDVSQNYVPNIRRGLSAQVLMPEFPALCGPRLVRCRRPRPRHPHATHRSAAQPPPAGMPRLLRAGAVPAAPNHPAHPGIGQCPGAGHRA